MQKYNKLNLRVDPAVFQHPADKAASDLVRNSDPFQKALSFISDNSMETVMYSINRSTFAEVTKEVSPTIDAMLREAEQMFNTTCNLSIFLERKYEMSALLSGIKRPYLIISTEFMREMDEDMLWGLIASEVAGVKNGFSTIKFVESLCNMAGGLIPLAISAPLRLMFTNWHKYAEFSFDRANLLATGNMNVTMQTILLGETPVDALKQIDFTDPDNTYMRQCREFLGNNGAIIDKIRDAKSIVGNGLFYATRYIELYKFYQSDFHEIIEEYQQV